jgi:hypothetical protein
MDRLYSTIGQRILHNIRDTVSPGYHLLSTFIHSVIQRERTMINFFKTIVAALAIGFILGSVFMPVVQALYNALPK